jgi:hypothetical protein
MITLVSTDMDFVHSMGHGTKNAMLQPFGGAVSNEFTGFPGFREHEWKSGLEAKNNFDLCYPLHQSPTVI